MSYDNTVGLVALSLKNHAASSPALHHLIEELEPEWELFAMGLRDEGLLVSDEQYDGEDGDDELIGCECDNTHEQNDTVCRWCWARGRRHWSDPDIDDGEPDHSMLKEDLRNAR
jgi:hypothetical protein